MTILMTLVVIAQNLSISLGVGCSTLAIVNFFVAIADGTIDEGERKMMGVTYTILRIAMRAIAITTFAIVGYVIGTSGADTVSTYHVAQLLILLVLFANAILMTKRLMPSTMGPALQAGSWYTLGILSSLLVLNLTNFSILQFGLSYVATIAFSVMLVNGVMWYLKQRSTKAAVPAT